MFGRALWRGLGRSLVLKTVKHIPLRLPRSGAWGSRNPATALEAFEQQCDIARVTRSGLPSSHARCAALLSRSVLNRSRLVHRDLFACNISAFFARSAVIGAGVQHERHQS